MNLEGNIWKYTLLLIANKRVFIAILGVYYLTIPGVTPQWVGIILTAGSIAGLLLEIPSGYASDKLGHKKALVISRVLMLLSTLFFLFSDSVLWLIIGGVLMSAGHAFTSGTASAFMHETMRALGREEDFARVTGKASSLGFAVPIVLMATVPFLVGISYAVPFWIGLVMDMIGLYAALTLVAPPVTPEAVEEIGVTNFRQVMREGHRLQFFRFAVLSGIIGGALIGVNGFRAPYQEFIGLPVIWFGVLFGAGRVIASLLLAYTAPLKKIFQTNLRFKAFQIVVYSVLGLSLVIFDNTAAVAFTFILLNGLQWGLSQVGTGFLLDIIRESRFKATLLSTKALITEGATAVFGVGIGFAIERFSYQTGFFAFLIAFLVLTVPLYLFIRYSQRLASAGVAQEYAR